MSVLTSPPQLHPPHIRPSSRSERLLRDTLRRDDTLRTTTSPQSRARSRSRSACSCDSEDEDLFKSTLLFRSSRPNSVASVSSSRSRSRAHTHPKSRYIPDGDEHTSYVQLLRSPSFSGSLREPKSPQYTSLTLEKQEDAPPYVRDAPHEAVLRTRLEHVLHLGMREVKREKERGAGTSSIEVSLVILLAPILSLWHESLTIISSICSLRRVLHRRLFCLCPVRAIPTSQNTPTSRTPKAMLKSPRRHHRIGALILRAPCPRQSPARSNPLILSAPQSHPGHRFRRLRGGCLIHPNSIKNKISLHTPIPVPRD